MNKEVGTKMSSNKEFNESNDEQFIDDGNFEYDQRRNKNYRLFDSNNFISKPLKSENCSFNENVIQLQYPLLNEIETELIMMIVLKY